ncbi:MAG: DUF2207 domain-containing protein [Chloroflexi bacterium]|nr:DUF2207 domain-containing protein [Chloroflexota bacterium]
MRFRYLRLIGFIVLLLVVSTGLAQAQSKTLYWDRWDVDIVVRTDGTFRVVERQTIEFTSGTFTFGIRGVDVRRLDRISDVEVREGDQVFQKSSSGQPWTFTTYMEGNEFKIKWYFPPTSDSRHTYTIAYTVHGGLRYYEEGDQLWWKAVVADRTFPVNASRVMVQIPEPAEVQNWDAYGVAAQAQKVDARTVIFEATEEIPPGREFEVRVQFTPGVVAGQPQPWQQEADAAAEWDQRWRPVVNVLMLAIGLLFLFGGPALLYLLWYTRGRDAPVKIPADYLIDPPADIPPGVAGTLLDEQADMEDIVATIVDLARRGVITIEEVREPGLLGIGEKIDFIYRLVGSTEGLRPFEETLIEEIFDGRRERRLSDLKNKFYRAIPKIKRQLYAEVVKEGYFRASPERIRNRYAGLGVVGLVLTGALTVCLMAFLSAYTDYAICPPIGIGITFVGLIVLARVMPRKTPKGAEAAARWRAFRRYLENIDKYANLEEAKDIFERYLPYAIAFGVEKEYVRKFAAVDTPAPRWYMPYPVEGPYVRPGRVSSGGGRPSGHAAEMPTGGGREGQMPSLEGMTRGTFGGLEAMTGGLFTMLNSASSTLSSRPSSSGSSGGFSGGGWSGGGSVGGGGGGGGSAGFG